jgi:trimeric autotransporter adhesin
MTTEMVRAFFARILSSRLYECKQPMLQLQVSVLPHAPIQTAFAVGFDFSGIDEPSIERLGDMYSLRYAEFVMPLVKAIQEQQAIIEELKQRVQALEGTSRR